ncbi:MAG: LysR family transcriptional regulator [Xanthobacteraceae bacterium]|nr:LysR family transcriptional regulator [Xanthobacteraceae bacterium]
MTAPFKPMRSLRAPPAVAEPRHLRIAIFRKVVDNRQVTRQKLAGGDAGCGSIRPRPGPKVDFRQIRYTLAVARERSFTKAAIRLNISQSAVSEQVRLLEDEIGFPLFRRTSRGIEVTERGRTFLYEAERVVGDVMSLSDTARRLRGAPSDTLTIGMGSGMAQIFMPRLFSNLRTILPGVRLEVLTAPTKSIFNDLHDERLDAGVAIESDSDRVPAGLVFDRLTEVEMVLIAHPRHPLARGRKPVDVGKLVGEPIIMSELTVGYGQVVLSLFTDLGIRPDVLAVADNIETMKAIVQSGSGIAIVPRACADNEVALGALRTLPIVPKRTVALSLFRRRQPLARRKEGYLAALRDALKD